MDRRPQLSKLLHDLVPNVYFQPDENTEIQYPCLVYSRDGAHRVSADNAGYRRVQKWQVTLIDRDPDNPAVETLGLLPLCTEVRSFVADGLTHDVFELFY